MATTRRFNPPPNWPPAPPGWTPPVGWQPDPAWGPLPPGWLLWIEYRANPRAWAYSFAFAGGFYLASLLLGFAISRGGLSAELAGAYLPRYAFAGLFTALIAWTRRSHWHWWMYPLIVLAFVLALAVITQAGTTVGR